MDLVQRSLLSLAITLLLAFAAYANPTVIPKEQPASAGGESGGINTKKFHDLNSWIAEDKP